MAVVITQWNNDLQRIDSIYSNIYAHKSCRNIQIHSDTHFCNKIDEILCQIIIGLEINKFHENLNNRIIQNNTLKIDPFNNAGIQFIATSDGRGYMEFCCPFTGFKGLALPIFIENKVIAILMIEQIKVLNENYTNIYNDIRKKYNFNDTINDIIDNQYDFNNYILKMDKKLLINPVANEKSVLNKNEYNLLISKTILLCEWLEKKLTSRLFEKRMQYINDIINETTNMFYSIWNEKKKILKYLPHQMMN